MSKKTSSVNEEKKKKKEEMIERDKKIAKARSKIPMINWYEKLPNAQPQPTYSNEKYMNINSNFRAVMIAPSGKGKGNGSMNVIANMNCFTNYYIYNPAIHEKLCQYMIRNLEKAQIDIGHDIVWTETDIRKIPTVKGMEGPDGEICNTFDQVYDKDENNLCIFDNFTTEKNQQPIEENFCNNRHWNCSDIYIGHDLAKIPNIIRGQCGYWFIFNLGDAIKAKKILEHFAGEKTVKQLMALYHVATNPIPTGDKRKDKNNKLNSFFLIDTETSDPDLKFRNQFFPFTSDELERASNL